MQELFHVLLRLLLLHRVDHCLESLRVVQGEVSQHLTVETHVLLCESADELGVVHTVLTGSGIDTLNPKRTEVAFLSFTVAVCVTQTFLIGILGYCPV